MHLTLRALLSRINDIIKTGDTGGKQIENRKCRNKLTVGAGTNGRRLRPCLSYTMQNARGGLYIYGNGKC